MTLGDDDIRNIAWLARLQVSKTDYPKYVSELSQVFDLIDQLNTVSIDGVVPMAHPTDAAQWLRADEVIEGDQREKFQQVAPATESGLYLVPRVVE